MERHQERKCHLCWTEDPREIIIFPLNIAKGRNYDIIFVLSNPIRQRKGGEGFGRSHYFLSGRCCGWCSLPLHHQMVRQRRRWQLASEWFRRKGIRKPSDCHPRVFVLVSSLIETSLFPFAYWHYSICIIEMQYSRKIEFYAFRFCSITYFDIIYHFSLWTTIIW